MKCLVENYIIKLEIVHFLFQAILWLTVNRPLLQITKKYVLCYIMGTKWFGLCGNLNCSALYQNLIESKLEKCLI